MKKEAIRLLASWQSEIVKCNEKFKVGMFCRKFKLAILYVGLLDTYMDNVAVFSVDLY